MDGLVPIVLVQEMSEGMFSRRASTQQKALAHAQKLAGQDVTICRGIIPYEKKMAYKALYNMNLVKNKRRKQGMPFYEVLIRWRAIFSLKKV